ncbi:uncharacterized protein LOC144675699 [Cetorhinus maximus]
MPILKQLGQTGPQGKRRSRLDLTREMISAPLGDFRHTMHVGRGGEAFGDTSFLSKRREEGGEEVEAEADRRPEGSCGGQRPAQQGALFPSSSSPPPPAPSAGAMRAAESVLSLFQVDLGPSMLSEVLGVMEKGDSPSDETLSPRGAEREREEASPSDQTLGPRGAEREREEASPSDQTLGPRGAEREREEVSPSDQTLGPRGAERVREEASPSVQTEEGEEEDEEEGNFSFEEEDEEIGV